MYEDEHFLPHTLSVSGSAQKPLGGLTEAIFEAAPAAQRQDMPLDRLLTLLMSAPDTALLIKRLREEPDGQPIPEPVAYAPWYPDADLPPLSSEERRTFRAFEQIVLEGRKSGKYEQAFNEIHARYPDVEAFAQLLLGYRLIWGPLEAARDFARGQLARHPGWLMVRLQLARSYLKEERLDLAGFAEAMDHRFCFHEHLAALESPATDLLVYQYHLELYLYYAIRGQLKRAAYCFNVCHKAASQPEGLIPLAPLLLASLDPEQGASAFRQVVRFLKP